MDEIEKIYHALDERLPSRPGNPCGACRSCCTARGLSYQNVQEVEYAGLQGRYGAEAANRFRAYAERRKDGQGGFLFEVCPFYDTAASGCGIHPHRPFACRLFGHFRMVGTRLPDPCVFEGTEREVARGRYFEEVPLASELRDLGRRHGSRQPQRWSAHFEAAAVSSDLLEEARRHANPDNDLDMAVLLHLEGRHEEALARFDAAVARGPAVAWAHFYRANLLDELHRPQEAAAAYRRACKLDPANPRFHLHLAIDLLETGDAAGARAVFQRTVELNPAESGAHGFLGYLLLMEGQPAAAAPHLERAVAGDAENPYFRLRLGEAFHALGRLAEAAIHLEAAAAHPRTAAEAHRLMEGSAP